ncbi:MAG: Hint domain-containing protein, partial [Phycisphaerales bacterium]
MVLADGSIKPVEALRPGERVAALDVAGLDRAVPWRAQYQWLRPWAEAALTPVTGTVGTVKLGTHEGFITINGRLRLTPEHPVLLKRNEEIGFASAEFVQVGDALVRQDLSEEIVETV